jgi:hypothetical protein
VPGEEPVWGKMGNSMNNRQSRTQRGSARSSTGSAPLSRGICRIRINFTQPQFSDSSSRSYASFSNATVPMHIAVIGGGPAGLRAAEVAVTRGAAVTVFDAKPSAGRKFLVSRRGGLNLTHSEPLPVFESRYRGPINRKGFGTSFWRTLIPPIPRAGRLTLESRPSPPLRAGFIRKN